MDAWRSQLTLSLRNIKEDRLKIINSLLCGAGLVLLLVGLAAAQDFQVGGPQGVHVEGSQGAQPLLGSQVTLPPVIYSNCGTGCTSYNNSTGYIVTTSSAFDLVAVQFTWTNSSIPFRKAIAANSIFTGQKGSKIGAVLLKDAAGVPGAPLPGGRLIFTPTKACKTIPLFPGTAPCTYRPQKPLAIHKGRKLWLCQYVLKTSVQGFWMLSLNDVATDNFYFNHAGTCKTARANWLSGSGFARTAFEIN